MHRRLLSYVMLLAIACAGMIPAGWMPAHDRDGKVLLVICTTDGTEERWVDLGDGAAPAAPADQMEDRSCPFSGLSAQMDLFENSPVVLEIKTTSGPRWSDAEFTHHSAGFHWRYDARGPPALS